MTNTRPLMKRVCAYLIDLLIVLTLSSIISSIPALNKNMDDYQETYKKYTEEYNKFAEYLSSIEESYEDDEITEEEYTKLIEIEKYKEIITSKYEDNKISQGEYKEIVNDINNQFDELSKDYVYILNKKGVSNSIITLVCTLLYFGVLQYFLKGQTIGKKLFKLKVVSASQSKITILNYILRSLIVNDIFLNGVGILFLLLTSKTVYTQANNILGILISISEATTIFLVLTRDDRRGLHDLLFNTKVISTNNIDEEKKEITNNGKNKVIEADYKEEVVKNNGEERNQKTRRNKK